MGDRSRGDLRLVLLLAIASSVNALKIDDTIHYGITFRTGESNKLQEVELLKISDAEEKETLTITSRNNENYVCHIPKKDETDHRTRLASYTGPSPAEILEATAYSDKVCSFRLEPYWGYELCHGRYVLQYHEERELKAVQRTEYYLGNFHQDYATKAGFKYDHLNPPTKMIDDVETPYFPVTYTKGTMCDITGKPRTITVLYICHKEGQENIHSLYEVSSCNYEAIVLNQRLCMHPAFAPRIKQNYEIECFATNGQTDPKPQMLVEQEKTSERKFSQEYLDYHKKLQELWDPDAAQMGERLNREYEELEKRKLEEIADDKNYKIKSKLTTMGKGKSTTAQEAISAETQKINDQIALDTINKILSGKECIQGGGGWWKYEFCYGSTVTQFHVQPSGERQNILLGTFDEAIHRAWIDENPKKRPIKSQGKIQQISQMYVKGDMCEETRSHRSVEVKLRCKSVDGSKLAVSIFLEEPSICHYVLTVESARFCQVLQEADDYGLFDTVELAQKARTKVYN
ncbi:unnamed protein product, partial [Mesorhabditis belari]|uniref:Endoplasmic reticulum lectin 1 n=1 Tax=Mesorhabditis belari TaxID=2138241 RepID=A0AAF3F2Y6_9BILA